MKTSRLEAFSDGVFAVIITIMVLEMKVPRGALTNFRLVLSLNGMIQLPVAKPVYKSSQSALFS